MTRILVTGGCGFIGSHLVEALVADPDHQVTVVDDLSSGRREAIAAVADRIDLVVADLRDVLDDVLPGTDEVWHLAANPEVRTGETDPAAHYDANVDVTWQLLEGMRRHGVRRLGFTSTSTVYGNATVLPTPEDYGPLLPISVYGGCKLACEALIAAHAGTFGLDAWLFRFANVVGPRSTHGVTYDFVHKLRRDPDRLEILGDGTQTKSYVHVSDTVSGMLHAARHAPPGVHPYNVGSLDAIPVTELARVVAEEMALDPVFSFSGGTRDGAGWTGDVKRMGLDVTTLRHLGPGWEPRHASAAAVRDTARWLLADA
jgi:UDP-glucose 4-epimerase